MTVTVTQAVIINQDEFDLIMSGLEMGAEEYRRRIADGNPNNLEPIAVAMLELRDVWQTAYGQRMDRWS